MSVVVSAWVWKHSPEIGSRLLVLLAFADTAHEDGTGVWLSNATLARKTRMSVRNVQLAKRALERSGAIVNTGRGPRGTTAYKVVMDTAEMKPASPRPKRGKPRKRAKPTSPGGEAHDTSPTSPEPSLNNRPPSPTPPAATNSGDEGEGVAEVKLAAVAAPAMPRGQDSSSAASMRIEQNDSREADARAHYREQHEIGEHELRHGLRLA